MSLSLAKHIGVEAEKVSCAQPLPDFRELYTAHFQMVWRMLLRLGIHERDVADVTQRVFLVAYRKLGEFEHRSKLSTWLAGITIRVARDWRSSAPLRREVLASDPALHAQSPVDVHASVELKQRLELTQRILGELPEEQRVVFVLYEIEEMSGDEIAEALHIPLGTARSRLRLARVAFRRAVARLTLDERTVR